MASGASPLGDSRTHSAVVSSDSSITGCQAVREAASGDAGAANTRSACR